MDRFLVRVRRYETVTRDCLVEVEALAYFVAAQEAQKLAEAGRVQWEEEQRGMDESYMVLNVGKIPQEVLDDHH